MTAARDALDRIQQGVARAFPAVAVAAAVLGAAHLLIRTSPYGAALPPDALNYVAAAESVADGAGLKNVAGGDLALWSPLFPLLLAFLGLFGLETAEAGRFLNAAAFGLIVLASGYWLGRNLRSPLLALGATAAVLAAPALNHAASHVWTGPLFVLCALVSLMGLEAFAGGRGGRRTLALAAVFAALATAIRFAGLAVILAAILTLLARRGATARQLLRYGGVIAAAALATLLAVVVRNLAASGSPGGGRTWSRGLIGDAPGGIAGALRDWAVPDGAPFWFGAALWIAVLAVALGAAAYAAAYRREGAAPPSLDPRRLGPALPFAAFAAAYPAAVAVAGLFTQQPADSRLLLPLYAPLLLTAAFLLDRFLHRPAPAGLAPAKRAVAAVALVACAAHVAFSAAGNLDATAEARDSGYVARTYNTAYWDGSGTIGRLRDNPVAGRIYTNDRDGVFWLAGVRPWERGRLPTILVPLEGAADCASWLAEAASRVRQEPHEAHVVLLERSAAYRDWCASAEPPPLLERVGVFADGAVYRVARTASTDDAYFLSAGAPVVGRPYAAALAPRIRESSSSRGLWEWERSDGAGGWTLIETVPGGNSYEYVPTPADVGLRLRAAVGYSDAAGRRTRAVTAPSDPVEPAP